MGHGRRDARIAAIAWMALGLLLAPISAEATERQLTDLPQDAFNVLFLWTEPIKSVVRQSRQYDPVSGLWIGLVDGSVKSFERSAQFLIFDDLNQPSTPGRVKRGPGKFINYNF